MTVHQLYSDCNYWILNGLKCIVYRTESSYKNRNDSDNNDLNFTDPKYCEHNLMIKIFILFIFN